MRILVNGQQRIVADGATLLDLAPPVRGLAVALNGAVVPSGSWATTSLSEDDAVELVTAHQGG
ncbi:sulfur carrier protein ThiS [Nocardioides pakistanensis]